MCNYTDDKTSAATGASYVRWGRTTCEGNAMLVYEGKLIT